MELRRLKWAFLIALAVLLVVLEWARLYLEPYLPSWQGHILFGGFVAMCIIFLVGAAFTVLSRVQESLARRNRELVALDQAARDIYGELSLETILQKVIDQARQLLEAQYGAITIVDDQGEILQFLTSGVSAEQKERIGEPPVGRGLLGLVLHEGQRLRLEEIGDHPQAAGMPKGHPPMHSLLATPIACKSPFRGNIYLSEKVAGGGFSREDEETMIRFAATSAVAIDNSYLHQQLQNFAVAEERARIGREMHDGMAQMVAYVNAKAQAVGEYLRRNRIEEAGVQLEQLAAAAREAYTDVREGILALRSQAGPERSLAETLREFFGRWQDRSGIAGKLKVDEPLKLAPAAELQLLRMTQEALTNVRKHSHADSVEVTIGSKDGRIVATIEDNGIGFEPESLQRSPYPRFGLSVMRERAESVGGTLSLKSRSGGGTRVRIEVPQAGRTE
jgi:signal transduction histidine kinase